LDSLICLGEQISIGETTYSPCSNDANNYNYCYTNNDDTTFTYCPNTPGDGITFMQIVFNSGSTEQGLDKIKVYDGIDDTGILIGSYYGDLSGLSFTATNPTGCLTFVLTSDGSISCASGNQIPLDYDVTCGDDLELVYSWLPDNGSLDNVSIANPTILSPLNTTIYTLSTYPTGHPNCVITDSVIISTVNIDSGQDSTVSICSTDPIDDLINYLADTPQITGQWYNPIGQSIIMPVLMDTLLSGVYEYKIDSIGCSSSTLLDVTVISLNSGQDNTLIIFPINEIEDLVNLLNGTPQSLGEWYNSSGQIIQMPVLLDTITNDIYEYRIDSIICSSSAYLDLTIIQIDTSTTLTNVNNIIATADNVQYQWLDCNLGYSEILGEISKTFIALNNGNYAVEITQNQYVDTSSCVQIYELNLQSDSQQNVIISPNPTSRNFNITLGKLTNVTVNIISSEGKLIYAKDNINTELLQLNLELESGLYFIQVTAEETTKQYKLIKK